MERFEISINKRTEIMVIVLIMISVFAMIISIKNSQNFYIAFFGFLFFSSCLYILKNRKINISSYGIQFKSLFKEVFFEWKNIEKVEVLTLYSLHSIHFSLHVISNLKKKIEIDLSSVKKAEVVRLCELLDERCPNAYKNEKFKIVVKHGLGLRQKLKLL